MSGTRGIWRASAAQAGAPRLEGDERLAVGGLVFLVVVTVLWWALALWPPPETMPAWVQTARAVCFGAHADGLPNAGGWILLVGEPIGMSIALWVIFRVPLESGLRKLAARTAGRALLATSVTVLLAGLALAGWRVRGATAAHVPPAGAVEHRAPEALDRPAAGLALMDQGGGTFALERLRGRPVLVTFAFAHCETVCPLLVRDALAAQAEAGGGPGVVVVTLDPWRDTPSRLPSIAASWKMGEGAHVLSGAVPEVEAVLAEWGIVTSRDPRNGDVAHPPVTYVLDAEGRVRFATTGTRPELRAALQQLEPHAEPRR